MPPASLSLLALATLAALTGCRSSYPADLSRFEGALEAGRLAEAKSVAREARDSGEASALVWTLELANAQRLAGDLPASIASYEAAEARLRAIDDTPEVSLSREGLSSFSNPYQLVYRGRSLDRVFASVQQALACLEAGEPARARVALNRTLFRVEDAKRLAAERLRIEREEAAEIAAEDNQLTVRLNSGDVASARAAVASRFAGLPDYGEGLNPFAAWLHGIHCLHTAEGPSDLELARKSLALAAGAARANPHLAADLALATDGAGRPDPGAGKTIVYVVHENGLAPRWSEAVVTLPLIYADPRAPIVNVALPALAPAAPALRPIEASLAGGAKATTALLADVDALVYAEFRQEYPVARNRAIASATMKGVVAYLANRAAQENARRNGQDGGAQWVAMAALLGSNLYAAGTAQADLRNWSGLPKQVEVARCVAPRGGQLRLSGGALVGTHVCSLPAARAVIVTVRSIAPGAPAVVRASILQP